MMHVSIAKGKFVKISPQKNRLVADLIRGKLAGEALTILRFSKQQKAAGMIAKVLNSAIANAQVKHQHLDVDNLFVSRIQIDEGPRMKRFRTAPRGRGVRIVKRSSHITICLGERGE